jgi:protein-disulfide isomerase/uncharacterized membrane protein
MSPLKKLSNSAVLALSLFGCLITLILFWEHLHPQANVGCSAIGGNCLATDASKYGHIGPIPTSLLGLGMYLTFAALCLARKKEGAAPVERAEGSNVLPVSSKMKMLDTAVWVMSTGAACFSLFLQKYALFEIFSFCPYCMASCLTVCIIFLLSTRDLFIGNGKLEGEQKLLAGTFALIGVLTAFMGLPELIRHINQLRTLPPIKVGVVHPKVPVVTADMHIIGDANAPYLIVEFADYQCNHCKKANAFLHDLMAKNPTKYRLAFRNYPLPMHNWANKAALAAEAAGEQGKFWEMHDSLFEHQEEMFSPNFKADRFKELAAELGLDVDKFSRDMLSDKITMHVAQDTVDAPKLEVKQTPSFFIVHGNKDPYMLSGNDQLKTAAEDAANDAWK